MTVVGLITTIGLFLVFAYALKHRSDGDVMAAWGWLFVTMCASTGALVNQAPASDYVFWYGPPAALAILSLGKRFWRTLDFKSYAFICLFFVNILALVAGLEGFHLFAGVTLLALTVWLQIVFLFLMARQRTLPKLNKPVIREQRGFDSAEEYPDEPENAVASLYARFRNHGAIRSRTRNARAIGG